MIPLQEYPRPAMRRDSYVNLNGPWQYAFTQTEAMPARWDGEILVPYSPECAASGVGRTLKPEEWLHYRRTFRAPPGAGGRVLLHFGAVDSECDVRVNGREVGRNIGGYWPFALEITGALTDGENELHVAVRDPSDRGTQARGKQTLRPGGMFYPAQSGIWQTVWLERVPDAYIRELHVTPDPGLRAVRVEAELSAPGGRMTARAFADGACVAEAHGTGALSLRIPNGDVRLWSPDAPFLYDLTVETDGGDRVQSYFALREWSCQKDARGVLRFCLNGEPVFLNGLLDQGYWPDGLYTPPSDEAVVRELETVKRLGFNLLRKHAKIEPQRWYYHCDRLGIVVWQDFVNGGAPYKLWFVTYLANIFQPLLRRFPDRGISHALLSRPAPHCRSEYLREARATLAVLRAHPCIACWVPFNEGWGQFDSRNVAKLVRDIDASRLIDAASGWFDQGAGDIDSIHNYFYPLRVRPGRRAVALSEYGGIAWPAPGRCKTDRVYGYGTAKSREELTRRYRKLQMETVLPQIARGLSAIVYTQLTDVEDEVNGILTYGREELKPDENVVRETNAALAAEFARCVRRG